LLVRYPRSGTAGKIEDRMAVNIDLAPTILDFAGVSIPESMQGRSLRPLIEGRTRTDWRKSVYYTYYENSWAALEGKGKEALTDPSFQYLTPHRGVRTDRYKLIEYYTDNYWELFDLAKDPNELRNVYSDPEYSQIASDLKRELQQLRVQYQDN
jgi:arylsulfatase A-like enzyme